MDEGGRQARPASNPARAAAGGARIERRTGAHALVAGLRRWGIERVFGLPGVHLDPFFDALHAVQDKMRVIHTRHEQGAAYMAFGAAMATGKPQAFAVVPGPGLLNAGAALATAYACNAPVLCITTTVVWPLLERKYGALHELPDQTGLLRGLTKWSARAEHASQIPALVDDAFRHMLTGRPRPVAIEIPPEILAQTACFPSWKKPPIPANPPPDPDLVAKAADIIAGAKAPAIVVGGGAQSAGAEVRALAERIQAPVFSRQMGRGVLSDAHDLSVQAPAANALWAEIDLVVGIGTRLQQLREWGADAGLKVVRIDLDANELSRLRAPDVALLADAGGALAAITDALRERGAERDECPLYLAGAKAAMHERMRKEIPRQLAYLEAIRAELPENGVLVDEITQVGHVAKLAFPTLAPRSLITSGYQGTLGYGFATALGAQLALPDRRVVSINGDGGFMYTMAELATAVLHDIPLVAIVFNDNCYGNVQTIQRRWYGDRVIATDLHNPDFARLAETFGALGLTAHSPEDLRQRLEQALAGRKPAVIEVATTPEEMGWPWSLILPQKVRGY